MSTDQKNIAIHSVKILKGKGDKPYTVQINYTELFPDNSKAVIPGEYDRIPHTNFLDVLKDLRVHLALLTDLINPKQVKDADLIDKFQCHGVSFTTGKSEAFVLKGHRKGAHGDLTINTRTIHVDGKIMKEHPLSSELDELLFNIRSEAAEYIRGKHAPDPQGNLFPDATNIQVVKPVIVPEGESDQSALYGKDLNETLTAVGSRLPKADPQAMERVKKGFVTSVNDVAAQVVADANIKKTSKRKVKQTAETPSGQVEE